MENEKFNQLKEDVKNIVEELEGCAHDVLDLCRQMQDIVRDYKKEFMDSKKRIESEELERKKRLVLDSSSEESK